MINYIILQHIPIKAPQQQKGTRERVKKMQQDETIAKGHATFHGEEDHAVVNLIWGQFLTHCNFIPLFIVF